MAKKPTLTTLTSGYASNTQLNNNFSELRDAFDNTLSLDGSTPNAMQADFDMNGYNILNADGIYVNGTNLLSLIDNVTVSTSAPSGGEDGDLWFKVSSP
jgi:hypothetical protein